MSAINKVDAGISQAIGNAGLLAGNYGKAESEVESSAVDIVTLASKVGSRKIANNYETVQFSELVPKPLKAKTLEDADYLSSRIADKRILKSKDEKELREDRIFAAIVGMRLMQQSGEDVPKRWVGGFDKPSDQELEAAYRRLTQRVSSPHEADDPEYIHNMRVELVDYYKNYKVESQNIEQHNESELENAAA